MNRNFSNRNRMFQTVSEVTETYKSIWETVPIFVIIFTEFKALLARIKSTAQIAGVDLTGTTSGKNNTLDALAALLFDICSSLAIFAKRTNNMELHAKVFIPEYAIKRKKDIDLIIFGKQVAALATEYKASLTDYALTEADIKKLTDLIALAEKETPVPDAKYSDRKAANAELESLFDETTDFLEEQLDSAVNSIRSKSSAFYNAYFASRNIKNIGIRHEKPEAPATEK